MMTATRYCVSWCYREQDVTVGRTLHSNNVEPCIEAARLINGNPYAFDVEVIEADTGRLVEWKPEGVGRVLTARAEGRP